MQLRVQAAFHSVLCGYLALPFLTMVLGWYLWDHVSHRRLIPTLSVLNLITVLGAAQAISYRLRSPGPDRALAEVRRFTFWSTLCGVAYGISGVLLYAPAFPSGQVLLVFMLGGLAAGSLTTHVTLPGALHLFHGPMLAPIIIRLFVEGERLNASMGAMLVAYSLVLSAVGFISSRRAWRSIDLQVRNAQLVEELKAAHTDLSSLTEDLAKRVEERTEALRASEERRARGEKLEAIGRIAGGVAHDFNNLLTVILITASVIRESCQRRSELGDNIEQILTAATRATNLTAQLLAFSRQQVVEPEILDFNECVREVCMMLARVLDQRITLDVRIDSAPARVCADRGQLTQIILNLATNARDAMPDGGTLTVSTNSVCVGGYDQLGLTPGDYMVLSMRDEGTGIRAETAARIFEPLFTTKAHGEGTGLGLANVHDIVTGYRGAVEVQNNEGEGAVFHVYLPRAEDSVEHKSQPVVADAVGQGRLLLVDDDAAVLHSTRMMLRQAGYEVASAQTSKEALDLAASGLPFDLLITDVVMPQITGPELVRQFARIHPDVPVLFVSGYTDGGLPHLDDLPPGHHFIRKPFRLEEFLAAVHGALARETVGSTRE